MAAPLGPSPSVTSYYYPLPEVGSVIEVLWDSDKDWWRTGTVVAWNIDAKRHEVAYEDEPDEDPVLERFWVKVVWLGTVFLVSLLIGILLSHFIT